MAHYIYMVQAGEYVRVYSILGQLVYEGQSSTIAMSQSGVYVVEVNGRLTKVRI